jgi:hypothetical protein
MSIFTKPQRPLKSFSHNDAWKDYAALAHTLNLSQSIFTCTTRIIRRSCEDSPDVPSAELRGICTYLINFLLKCHHFTASIDLFKHSNDHLDRVTKFPLKEWSSIIAIFVLSRRLHATCTSNELRPSFELAYESCAIAEQLAKSIPEISLGEWLLVAALRPLSLLMYAMRDTELLIQHRRNLRSSNKPPYSIDQEVALFGLPHPALCQIVAQRLGLGVKTAMQLREAYDTRISFNQLDERGVHLRAASMWIDSLLHGETLPTESLPAKLYPPATQQKLLVESARLINAEGVPASWLDPRAIAPAPIIDLSLGEAEQALVAQFGQDDDSPMPDSILPS